MIELSKLIKEGIVTENSIKIPDDAEWYCEECGWRGLVQDCETEPEPIGYMEGPWYDMPICPKCGAGISV